MELKRKIARPCDDLRMQQVGEVIKAWHEPGRQDRCLSWIYNNKVEPIFKISERTYKRYCTKLGFYKTKKNKKANPIN